MPNQGPPDSSEPKFSEETTILSLRITSYLSPSDHHQKQKENQAARQELKKLYRQLTSLGTNQKFDSFNPQTDEQRRLAKQYNSLKNSLHSLPAFHYQALSLDWVYPERMRFHASACHDKNIGKTGAQIIKSTLSLLSTYPVLE
ncbi:MAG: hypothetical protein ACPGUY_08915 [Akkermansiaceae bacterium]